MLLKCLLAFSLLYNNYGQVIPKAGPYFICGNGSYNIEMGYNWPSHYFPSSATQSGVLDLLGGRALYLDFNFGKDDLGNDIIQSYTIEETPNDIMYAVTANLSYIWIDAQTSTQTFSITIDVTLNPYYDYIYQNFNNSQLEQLQYINVNLDSLFIFQDNGAPKNTPKADSTSQLILGKDLTIQYIKTMTYAEFLVPESYNNAICRNLLSFEYNNTNASYVSGYNEGYAQGEENGSKIGYQNGYADGQQSVDGEKFSLDWLTTCFNAVNIMFDVEILPGFKLWYLIGIPLFISLIFIVLKIFR